MDGEAIGRMRRSWNSERKGYRCSDDVAVKQVRKMLPTKNLSEQKSVLNSGIMYTKNSQMRTLSPRVGVSGTVFSRDVRTIFGSPDGIRTIAFPTTVRTVRQGSFYKVQSLRAAVLNEGLEVLGTEPAPGGKEYHNSVDKTALFAFYGAGLGGAEFPAPLGMFAPGAFADGANPNAVKLRDSLEMRAYGFATMGAFRESGIVRVKLPSTLKRIEGSTFQGCRNLRTICLPEKLAHIGEKCFYQGALESVRLPPVLKVVETATFLGCRNLKRAEFAEGLERISPSAFFESGIERIEFPASLRTIGQAAFARCESLRSVVLNEGLGELGTVGHPKNGTLQCGVFQSSAVEHVVFPSTLKKIGDCTFENCQSLRHVVLPDCLEFIGGNCFYESALESVTIPPTLREI